MIDINPITDVMQYYHFALIPLYCVFILMEFCCFKSLKGQMRKTYAFYAIILAFFSTLAHYLFLGVLADNQADISMLMIQNHIMLLLCLVNLFFVTRRSFREE
ncbi:MAG: hypothetical protein HFI39_09210 [Lachnospiraceae bacterium]|nr:hypothetical protein [Lachnospiraceae bacterium]